MSELKLGQLIEGYQERDAIHIAVAPVVAAEHLAPGQHVGFTVGWRVGTCDAPIGIVDPFLTVDVEPGQQCWLFLYPQTITALRHDWTHPAFAERQAGSENARAISLTALPDYVPPLPVTPAPDRRQVAARQWLEAFASEVEMSYEELLEATHRYLSHGRSVCLNFDTPSIVYYGQSDFWLHYETVTRRTVEDHEAMFFHCAC